jgi:uncharacterized protein (TIGR02231 family)
MGDIMKYQTLGYLFSTALLSTTLISAPTLADIIKADTQITKATVYQNSGADVTRTGKVDIPTGSHEITISNLPQSLQNTDVIRAFFSNKNITINSIKTEHIFDESTPNAEQKRLKGEIEKLEIAISDLVTMRETAELKLKFITAISQEKSDIKDSAEEWQAKLTLISENLPTLKKEITTLKRSIKSETNKLTTLKQQLNNTGLVKKPYYETHIAVLNSAEATSADFTLTYAVRNAGWSTSLNAALNSSDDEIEVKLNGSIYQNSGEDWNNIKLALSTTRPRVGALPEIPSEFLSVYVPQPAPIARSSAKIQMDRMESFEASNAEEIIVTGSRLRQTQFDANYELYQNVTIVADREAQSVPIKQYTFKASDIVLKATPRFAGTSPYIYALSDMKALDTQLTNVNVNLTRDGNYLGSMQWPNLTPNTETSLPFGIDTKTDIKITELPPEDGDTGFFNSKRVEETRYLFTVTNNHDVEQTIEIYDRMPVSAHKDVKVTTLKSATKPSEKDLNGKAGVVKWVKTLKPGEIWNIHHEYRITYPEKQRISRRNTK